MAMRRGRRGVRLRNRRKLGQGNVPLEEGKQNNHTDRREKVITAVTEGKQIERRFKRKAGKKKLFNRGQRREGEG